MYWMLTLCRVLCHDSVAQRVEELAQGHTGGVAEWELVFRSLRRRTLYGRGVAEC